MKTLSLFSVAGMLLSASLLAAPNTAVNPVVVQPVQTFQPGADGRLAYSTEDLTRLLEGTTKEWFAQRRDDLVFLEKSTAMIVDQYNAIYMDLYTNKLRKLSDESMTNVNQMVPAAEFLALRRAFQGARELYVSRLEQIKSIPEGGLPSATIVTTSNKNVDLPAMRKLDMSKVITTFTQKLENLDTLVGQLQFRIVDRIGKQVMANGFNLDFKQLTIILPGERDQKRAELNKLRELGDRLTKLQDKLRGFTYVNAKNYIQQYGTEERWRMRNAEDLAAAKDLFDRVADAFWVYSYERMKYGMPMGAMRMNYKKRWLNIDEVIKNPEEFLDFGDKLYNPNTKEYLSLRTETQLNKVIENIRQNARSADHQALVNGSWNPLVLLAKVWTVATGRVAQLETTSLVLKLIEADAREELLVLSAGGRDKMVDYYNGRYKSDEEGRKATLAKECAYDPKFTEARMRQTDASFRCGTSSIGSATNVERTSTFFSQIEQSSRDQFQNFRLAQQLSDQLDEQTGTNDVDQELLQGLGR